MLISVLYLDQRIQSLKNYLSEDEYLEGSMTTHGYFLRSKVANFISETMEDPYESSIEALDDETNMDVDWEISSPNESDMVVDSAIEAADYENKSETGMDISENSEVGIYTDYYYYDKYNKFGEEDDSDRMSSEEPIECHPCFEEAFGFLF